MWQSNHNLASLIGSRICHDLISPIGAIQNGVELLTLDSSATAFSSNVLSGVYRASNDNPSAPNVPKGFKYDQGSGRDEVSFPFPILFDISFNQTKVQQLINYINDGYYIDQFTASLNMLLCMTTETGLGKFTASWKPNSNLAGDSNMQKNLIIVFFYTLKLN